MINSYILLYQYFDMQEIKLVQQIDNIQSRAMYRDPRSLTDEEVEELHYARIKLSFLRKIGSDLLKMFQEL